MQPNTDKNNELEEPHASRKSKVYLLNIAPGTPKQNGHVERKFAVLKENIQNLCGQKQLLRSHI